MRVNVDKAFFTSDTHFFHKAMAQMRGLQGGVDDMNAALITRWNEVVPKDGIVFLLGDFSFSGTTNSISVLGQLNGQIHLIVGNHDTGLSRVVKDMFSSMSDYKEIEVETAPAVRQRIILSHYAHRVWNMHHYGNGICLGIATAARLAGQWMWEWIPTICSPIVSKLSRYYWKTNLFLMQTTIGELAC